MIHEHEHRCRSCRPEWDGPRQSEGHIAVRFGDRERLARPGKMSVKLDGREVLNDCDEFCAGQDGFAVLMNDPAHACPCSFTDACMTKVSGVVEFRQSALEAA